MDQGISPTGVRSPSAIVRVLTWAIRWPDARPLSASLAPSNEGSAPKTRIPVPCSAVQIPESMPPPPIGAMTASRPFFCFFCPPELFPAIDAESLRTRSEDDIRMVIRRDQGRARPINNPLRHFLALLACAAGEDDFRAVAFGACDLARRADRRHHDVGGDGEGLGCEGQRLRMVPAAVGYDAAGPDGVDAVFFDQAAECVEGAAGFEGADFLLVLAFEEEADGGFRGVGGDGGVICRGAVRSGFAGGVWACGGTSLVRCVCGRPGRTVWSMAGRWNDRPFWE
ncbi:hypothetical protein KC362_g48 [Hortaea werneckii]|nr:hypothetical protein KC362_g48 [Hortaea werneckii]